MYKIIVPIALVVILSSCALGNALESNQTYCLQEVEKDNLDYMTVVESSVCENTIDDVELFDANAGEFEIGDVVYVEIDSHHSKTKKKTNTDVKRTNVSTFVTTKAPIVKTTTPKPTKKR